MKTSTTFNITLILEAEKQLKPLALYYLLKAKYHHSIVFEYSPHKLSKLTGLHHKTIKRYLKKLDQLDLIVKRDGHLLFKKQRGGVLKRISTRPWTSYKEILNRIYLLTILNNLKQQKYKLANKYGINVGTLSPSTRRKAIKGVTLQKPGLENALKPVITIQSVSKLFNVSLPTSFRILKELKNKRYIKTKPFCLCIGRAIPLKYTQNGAFFNKNGFLFRYYGSLVSLGSYTFSLYTSSMDKRYEKLVGLPSLQTM